MPEQVSRQLDRSLGVGSATLLGLGSIFGTGIFVSIGLAAGITGASAVLAIVVAACLALCNALSSAQLAAAHPVSGGTYEYGYRLLNPTLGFTAGWMFLAAKSASAATAALGASAYGLALAGVDSPGAGIAIAFTLVVSMTWLAAHGMKRSSAVNAVIVGVTVLALTVFAVAAFLRFDEQSVERFTPLMPESPRAFFHATAILFVAYTGYGRIATLGEEVRDPQRTIPKAILATLALSAVVYVAVAIAAIGTIGAPALSGSLASSAHASGAATPLEFAARELGLPGVPQLVAVGAVTAMLGVLLNLVLGLSRIALAMGRRRDLPAVLDRIGAKGTPAVATWAVGAVIAGLTLIGDVRTTWSLSALTVLLYYSITNLAVLRLPREQRLYSPFFAVAGLAGCLSLATFVPASLWAWGLGLLAVGLAGRGLAGRIGAQ